MRAILNPVLVLGAVLSLLPAGSASAQEAAQNSTPLKTDFLDAAWLPALERVLIVGHHGLVALAEVGEDQVRVQRLDNVPDADFSAVERIADGTALIGSSTGRVYRFDGETITEVAALSEYDEPVLDIAAGPNGIWAVGARGLVARSSDGQEFEEVEIRDVVLERTEFPGAHPADWYFGVSNLDVDSIEFSATVGGEPAVEEEHFVMYPDEGFVQFQTQLDETPPPAISFRFSPGPPFRLGDVSWNVVLLDDDSVTLAGEFGMILQSYDNGETWTRRDTEIVPREPEPAYWMAGTTKGDVMWLTGAAGVSQRSDDGGETWTDNPKPGREGIFGVALTGDDTPLIAGAVGLMGTMRDGDWTIADRTRLKLLSWLRTPVTLPDGSVVVFGGRAAALRYRDGKINRIPVSF
ncbi:MAG: hypothetical protein ACU85V_18590 [Gammaproteobacteria bacterium]